MLMAGGAAEELVLSRASSSSGGADESDLARATRIAFDMERTTISIRRGFGQQYRLRAIQRSGA
ncbi:hypothetical protein [Agrobacterium pusense]|uniref:hypothetical protein n=1 Tax=Agrobacterium pusense TaxID=648995 RepID=UPI002FDD633C